MASVELAIDLSIFPLTAVQRTAYDVSAQMDVGLGSRTENVLSVRLTARAELGAEEAERLFRRRLLDLSVQEQIHRETAPIRQALINAALEGARAREKN